MINVIMVIQPVPIVYSLLCSLVQMLVNLLNGWWVIDYWLKVMVLACIQIRKWKHAALRMLF